MQKRKQGEREAILILENLGIEIEKNYYDDNSHSSMPDIRCKSGRYIEVTHTLHNNALQTGVSNYFKLQPGENWNDYIQRHSRVENECSFALNRINKMDYEKDEERQITEAGKAQFEKDVKLVKEHMGYDYTERDLDKRYSEFKCDCPTYIFSPNNILREILKDKGKKYPNGDIDLFIFVTDEEFRLMQELISQKDWNGVANNFLTQIYYSPFPKIYVCEWDFDRQEYNTNDPRFITFYKSDDRLKWEWRNIRHEKTLEICER